MSKSKSYRDYDEDYYIEDRKERFQNRREQRIKKIGEKELPEIQKAMTPTKFYVDPD